MERISVATVVLLSTLTTLIEFSASLPPGPLGPPPPGIPLDPLPPEYGDGDAERVIGGQNAENGMFPWTVALYFEGQFICTGSIISENAILTAAHCVVLDGKLRDPQSFHAIGGDVNRNAPNVEYINFANITVHPKYTPDLKNDLAVLKTLEPIPFGPNLQPICIASPNIERLDNKEVVAMGWGQISRSQNNVHPEILQYTPQRVISNFKCFFYQFGAVTDSVICARGILSGICQGDSGGPLVYFKKGKPIQVGIASFTNSLIGCGRYFGPAGFVRVSSYTKFITESAGGSVCLEK